MGVSWVVWRIGWLNGGRRCLCDKAKKQKANEGKGRNEERPEKDREEAGWFLHFVFSFTTDHRNQGKTTKRMKTEREGKKQRKKGNSQPEDKVVLSTKVWRGERETRFSRRSSMRERTVSWASKRLVPMMPDGPLLHQPAT